MKRDKYRYMILLAMLIVSSSLGCSIKRMAIRTAGLALNSGVETLYEEEDLILAEQAIMANLKLVEGLIKGDPGNRILLIMVSQGFTGYAMGFVEDKDPQRAKIFYKRARDYGLEVLNKNRTFKDSINGNFDELAKALKRLKKKDVPALFWTANAWGNLINVSRDSPSALANMGKVELIMKRSIELDESFYYGGGHMFFASFYGGRSEMFGGSPDKAKKHFDRFVQLSNGKFLLGYVLYAQYYAVQMQDSVLFRELLDKVLETPGSVLPEQRLANEIAKVKAKRMLSNIDDYF
ncbi:MAG: TRAP transporter TatT component family protein [Candidatus Anammoxibacter sp.]